MAMVDGYGGCLITFQPLAIAISNQPSAIDSDKERIIPTFPPNRRIGPVARMDDGGVAERKEHVADRRDQHVVVTAGQVGASNRPGEERVADKQVLRRFSLAADREADAAGTMARRVVDGGLQVSKRDRLARRVEQVDRRLRLDGDSAQLAVLGGVGGEGENVPTQT